MKKLYRMTIALIAAAFAAGAFAQSYPVNTPTYTPTAALAPATLAAPGDYTFAVSGISTITFRVSGTCTSLAVTPQGTNDGTNWSTIQAIPVAGGALVTSITGTGMWRVNASGMTKARLHITALTASCTFAAAGSVAPGALYLMNPNTTSNPSAIVDQTSSNYLAVDSSGIASVKVTNGTQSLPTMDAAARKGFVSVTDGTNTMPTMDAVGRAGFQKVTDGTNTAAVKAASTNAVATDPALVVAISPNSADPCQNPAIAKSSVAINIASAVATKVVALSSSKITYVCGFSAVAAGTSPTLKFHTGTKVTNECDTTSTDLTGTFAPTAGTLVTAPNYGGTVFQSVVSKDLCITSGGTPSIQGVLTYVQQ